MEATERHPHQPPSQARQLAGVRGSASRARLRRRSSSVGDVDPGDRKVPATLMGWRPTTRHIRSWPPIRSASTMPRSSTSTSSMRTRCMRRCRPTSRSGSPRRWWGCSCTSSTGSRAGRFSGFTRSSQRNGRPGRGSRSRTIAARSPSTTSSPNHPANDVIGDRVVGDLDVERVPRPSRVDPGIPLALPSHASCDLTTGPRRRGADPSRTGPRCQFGTRVGSRPRAKLCVASTCTNALDGFRLS
jgi:hypothetical protein